MEKLNCISENKNILSIQSEIGNSKIIVGESLSSVSEYLPAGKKTVIITDSTVKDLYGQTFPEACLTIEIPQGENNKVLHTLDLVFEKMTEAEIDRTSFILGIGGGIVCDVAGFAASVYMRGIEFGFVSTTLLSQVDASTGGKNGVNFNGYKNMIGTFNLPEFVICDQELLKTLPRHELISGMAEVVKHGAIADPGFFRFIEENAHNVLMYDIEVLEKIVYESVVIKSGIVKKDVKENGVRKILNFGHTIGHAVEKFTGMQHGMAISTGMTLAAEISAARGLIEKQEADRIPALLQKLGLPVKLPIGPEILLEAIRRDKKREGDHIKFVLLDKIGSACIEKISLEELKSILNDLY
ncbi:MAG TPA: 3-dehydroquinate synthase [Ignavibacteria bacterium]|nr:3-dehydroquinate synthase [Ignavibacteria bacterium]HMR39137.1 3-dehydroquinate synthase [Ignavibacteria bacterium]